MKTCQIKNINIGEGIPKICVPLVSSTLEELLEEVEEIKGQPVDLVEWRMDMFDDITIIPTVLNALQQIRKSLHLPLLCTFRTQSEGGNTPLLKEEYITLNTSIITSGNIDMIDIELSQGKEAITSFITLAKEHNVKVLLSNHDFHKTPSKEEIIKRLTTMVSLGADIAKIAVMPTNKQDVLTLLDATITMHEQTNIPIVTMSMKHDGLISRLVGETFGSSITFGSIKNASAPGQIFVKDLANILQVIHKQ